MLLLVVTVNIKNMIKIRSITWNVLHIFCVILIFNRQERMYLLHNSVHNDSISLVTKITQVHFKSNIFSCTTKGLVYFNNKLRNFSIVSQTIQLNSHQLKNINMSFLDSYLVSKSVALVVGLVLGSWLACQKSMKKIAN